MPYAAFKIDRAWRNEIGPDILGGKLHRQSFNVGNKRCFDPSIGLGTLYLDNCRSADYRNGTGTGFFKKWQSSFPLC